MGKSRKLESNSVAPGNFSSEFGVYHFLGQFLTQFSPSELIDDLRVSSSQRCQHQLHRWQRLYTPASIHRDRKYCARLSSPQTQGQIRFNDERRKTSNRFCCRDCGKSRKTQGKDTVRITSVQSPYLGKTPTSFNYFILNLYRTPMSWHCWGCINSTRKLERQTMVNLAATQHTTMLCETFPIWHTISDWEPTDATMEVLRRLQSPTQIIWTIFRWINNHRGISPRRSSKSIRERFQNFSRSSNFWIDFELRFISQTWISWK